MKKTLSIVIVTVMLLALAAGCGKTQQAPAQTSGSQTSASPGSGTAASSGGKEFKDVELSAIYLWQGSGVWRPDDEVNNAVAKVLREKTGVTIKTEYITTDATEKLNMLFASGQMPDILSAWFGGFNDYPAMTQMIKKAAKEGLLTPIDEYLDNYPNLKYAVSKEALPKDFYEVDMQDPAFGGKTYVIPWETPYADVDQNNYSMAVNLWVREDIIKALGVDAASIDNSEKLQEFLMKIKNGGFNDINGNAVIPYGVLRGWMYFAAGNSYRETSLTPFTKINGEYRLKLFSENMEKYVLYMRGLVNQKLFDNEHFSQTDAILKEKVTSGRYGIIVSHYARLYETITTTLLVDHPEMKYVALGPIKNAFNEPVYEAYAKKQAPSPCIVLSKTCKDPEAAVRFIDYIDSEEGQKLVLYGVEGVHYTSDPDGKPRPTDEWLKKFRENPRSLWNEGIRSIYSMFISADRRISVFGEYEYGFRLAPDPVYVDMSARTKIPLLEGFRVDYLGVNYPKFNEAMETINSLPSESKAFFAKSDEEALKILGDIRNQAVAGGIKDYEAFLNAEAAKRNDTIN